MGFRHLLLKTHGLLLVLLICSPFLSGCSRQHYRVKADREAYGLLSSVANDPRWKIDDYRIDVDPRSRMFDAHDPDCEPMPPDDPTAHGKMHCVDGKKGYKHWGKCGCTKCVENPFWKNFLLYNERGAVSLDLNGAFELALLHSPEYQNATEAMYVSALDVAGERFAFDMLFYGGDSLLYTAGGGLRSAPETQLDNQAFVEMRKKFATGGELIVGLANSVTWTFSGPDTWTSNSIFNYSITQPLLRNAGRKIVLENLTQEERNFLATVRRMAFFQQGFYTAVVTGQGFQQMDGTSSVVVPGGFYGLLSRQVRLQNQRQNILSLEENLDRLELFFQAGSMDDNLQVEQTRQQLFNSESSLLQDIGGFETTVETFLTAIGLPPDLKVEIDDPLLEQFQMIPASLQQLQEEANQMLALIRKIDSPLPENYGERLKEITRKTESEIESLYLDLAVLEKTVPKRIEELRSLESNLRERIRQGERIDPSIFDADVFQIRIKELKETMIPDNVARLRAALFLIDAVLAHEEEALRQKVHSRDFDAEWLNALNFLRIDLLAETDEERDEKVKAARETLESVREFESDKESDKTESLEDRLDARLVPKGERTEAQKIVAQLRETNEYRDFIRRVLSAFQTELTSLSIMRTRCRLDSITLTPTSIAPEEAFAIASENRLDWMNRRATLVDSWRKIEIAANQLRGNLNVRVEGEVGRIDQSGLRLDGNSHEVRVGVEWDSPLTRNDEMIDYRKSQVSYQRARRDYYTYVDSVNADLRQTLRDIRINQVDFEIKRNALLVATMQVDLAQLKLMRPPVRGQTLDSSTARDLISALSSLLDKQNEFLSTWVSYQTQRMLLDLRMGTMELDEKGRWIDPGTISKDRLGKAALYNGPYAGAFARETALVPSQRPRRGWGRKKSCPHTVRHDNGPYAVPPAPRLEGEVEAAPVPMLAPPEFEDFPEVIPMNPSPAEGENGGKSGASDADRPKPVPKTVASQAKTARKHVPHRSALSPDTVPEPATRPARPLKVQNAPPPPKTPE